MPTGMRWIHLYELKTHIPCCFMGVKVSGFSPQIRATGQFLFSSAGCLILEKVYYQKKKKKDIGKGHIGFFPGKTIGAEIISGFCHQLATYSPHIFWKHELLSYC